MRIGRQCVVVAALLVIAAAMAMAEDEADFGRAASRMNGDDAYYERLALDPRVARQEQFLTHLMMAPAGSPNQKKRESLDLTPLAERAIGYVQGMGMPIVEHHDEKGRRPIAVSAQFSIASDTPDVKMHLGDRPFEPMGAFYPARKGFRFAVIYPMKNFSLRLEGGEDSEFGSIAVAGFSWVHPSKRFAAGFGLHGGDLDNTRSEFGAIFQFRMNLQRQE